MTAGDINGDGRNDPDVRRRQRRHLHAAGCLGTAFTEQSFSQYVFQPAGNMGGPR